MVYQGQLFHILVRHYVKLNAKRMNMLEMQRLPSTHCANIEFAESKGP